MFQNSTKRSELNPAIKCGGTQASESTSGEIAGGLEIHMNYKRLVIGAATASVVLLIGETVFILIMGKTLMAARSAAGLPEIAPNALLSIFELLLTGNLLVWLYASIRTRYGPGVLTA